jgi:hypothetical protein
MPWEHIQDLDLDDGPEYTLSSRRPTYYESDDKLFFDRMNYNNLVCFCQILLYRQWMQYMFI